MRVTYNMGYWFYNRTYNTFNKFHIKTFTVDRCFAVTAIDNSYHFIFIGGSQKHVFFVLRS